ncbi:MAG: glutamine amidotransferase-related protein [Nitrososphaerota archaeon]
MCTLLVLDNGSAYTKNLIDFLLQKKLNFTTLTHDKVQLSQIVKFNSFILSGRTKNNQSMNVINSKIINHAVLEKKPLLGICYGAEILALTLGGTIRKTGSLQKGSNVIDVIKNNPICTGKLDVFESHSYEISRLNDKLVGIAKSEYCQYEIIQHKELDIFGTQFHPEMSTDGQKLIESFVNL